MADRRADRAREPTTSGLSVALTRSLVQRSALASADSPGSLSVIPKTCSGTFSGTILWLISWMNSSTILSLEVSIVSNNARVSAHSFGFIPGSRSRSNNRTSRTSGSGSGASRSSTNAVASPFFSPFSPFGFGNQMSLFSFGANDNFAGDSNFFSTTTFGMSSGGHTSPAVKRTSTSTRISNGKKIVTKKYHPFFFPL